MSEEQLIAEELLERAKLFLFTPESGLILNQVRNILSKSSRWYAIGVPPELIELLYIVAAKFAVLRQSYTSEFPLIRFPIKVISTDADLAIQKYDTILSRPCAIVKRLSEHTINLEDVFLFNGDLLKFQEIAARENWDTEKKINAIETPQKYIPMFIENIEMPFKAQLLRHLYQSPFLWLEGLLSKLQMDIAIKKDKEEIYEEIQVVVREMKSSCGYFAKFLE